ncbi:MAG: radical SAM protein [Campylobacterota bacterium]|nr:radical SAM protein [Campylobacterota bacterium]
MNIIFGPVNSRRFGVSLGIDLSPTHKQCNFDCLYCELAPALTIQQQDQSISVTDVINALTTALKEHQNIDVITITANGEPTLYPYLNELIDEIDAIKGSIQTLILTNSATLINTEVYNTLLKFDQVKLSLDAISSDVFKKIDRPHEDINILHVKESVIHFSKEYNGRLFIEILFVHTLNDTDEEIALLNETLLHVNCERVDLGTIDRPPAYPVMGISYSELHSIAHKFDASVPIHIASRQHAESCQTSYSNEEIINTLDKRPLTHEDVKLLFDNASQGRLLELIKDRKVSETKRSGLLFLIPSQNIKRKRQKS